VKIDIIAGIEIASVDSYLIIIYNKCLVVYSMDPSIQLLEIAPGLKDSLSKAGFTIDTILSAGPTEVASALGIESYVAKIIFDAAKKIVEENTLLGDPTTASTTAATATLQANLKKPSLFIKWRNHLR
jgi:hypothetical protein